MRLFRDLAGALGFVMVVLALLAPRESYGDGDYYTDVCAQNDGRGHDPEGDPAIVTCNSDECRDAATNVCVSACGDERCDGENDLCLCKSGVRGCVCTRR
jgi:hypothetical protein